MLGPNVKIGAEGNSLAGVDNLKSELVLPTQRWQAHGRNKERSHVLYSAQFQR